MKNRQNFRFLTAGVVLLLAILACSPFQLNAVPQPTQTTGAVNTPVVVPPTQSQQVLPPTQTFQPTQTRDLGPIRLAYVVGSTYEEQDADIYVANEDGSGAVCVACEACSETEPAFSLDGMYVVYQSTCPGYPDIFIVNSSGYGAFNLTKTPTLSEREPAFSPDGTQVVFRVNPPTDDRNKNGEIFVMNMDGSNKHSLGIWGRGPTWSWDGKKLAYMSDESGTWQIYVYYFESGQSQQLTHMAVNCRWPAWEAASDGILFNTTLSATSMDPDAIYWVAADGSRAPWLAVTGVERAGRPAISWVGLIAFNTIYGIEVFNVANDEQYVLVANEDAWAPTWSH